MIENLDRKTIEIVLSRIAIGYKKGHPERDDWVFMAGQMMRLY